MGITKTNLFSEYQNEIAQIAKAFDHPARVAIIQHLITTNKCINSDLVQELGLAQATISQHLRELKDIGIIHGSIEGASICYCINQNRWEYIKSIFIQLFNSFQQPEEGNCC